MVIHKMQLTLWARLLYLVPAIMWRTVLKTPLKPDALRRLQNKKLRALITHSYAHVPYYHNLFKKAGLRPDDIQTIDDLPKIPITRKTDLRDLPVEDVLASDYTVDQCLVRRTSGTTGIPLTVYWNRDARLRERVSTYRRNLEWGQKVTGKMVSIGADTILPQGHWLQQVGIFRSKWIEPHLDVMTQVSEITAYDPQSLRSYPSILEALCKEVVDKSIRGLDIRLVISSGEHLDAPTRAFIEKALGAEVFERCGAREVGNIFNECVLHHGQHTNAEVNVVEVTRDGENLSVGETGEVTVTNLENQAMPFIRYDLEDIGLLVGGDCSCGNSEPRMQLTEGRTTDRIPLPDGRRIPATVPIEVLRYIEGLRQFQVIQEAHDRIVVQIIPGRGMAETAPDEIREQLKPILGDVEIEVREVDAIPRERSGKLRQFISHVPTA